MVNDSKSVSERLHAVIAKIEPAVLEKAAADLKVPSYVNGRPVSGLVLFEKQYPSIADFVSALREDRPGAADAGLGLAAVVAPEEGEQIALDVLDGGWAAGKERALAALGAIPTERAFERLLSEAKKGTRFAGGALVRNAYAGGCKRVRAELDQSPLAKFEPFELPTEASLRGLPPDQVRSVWGKAQKFDPPQAAFAADLVTYLGRQHCQEARPLLMEWFRSHPFLWYHAGMALESLPDDPETLDALARHVDRAENRARGLGVRAILRRDPKTAYDVLGVPSLREANPAMLELILQQLLEDSLGTRAPSRGFLQADPRWLELAVQLEKDKTFGQTAKYLLTRYSPAVVDLARGSPSKTRGTKKK